jgi:bacteriocin biosynthesis cyclodehydratase domain-containing protein
MNKANSSAYPPDIADSVRPKMLNDSIFLPTRDGILFRSRDGSFRLNGPRVYELMSSIVAHLTGKLTIVEICSLLDAQRSKAVRRMIAILLEKRIAVNHIVEESDLGEVVLRAFQSQINFIEHFEERPVAKFARFRHARVLLTGTGTALRSLVLSLVKNGLQTIILDEKQAHLENDRDIRATVEEFRSAGIPTIFEKLSLDQVLADEGCSLTAVCHAGDSSALRDMLKLNETCLNRQILFIPGVVLGAKAFVGPLVQEDKTGCWLCFLMRHSACLDPRISSQMWEHIAVGRIWRNEAHAASSPSLKILGNMVGFELFRVIIGHIPSEIICSVLSLDLETLENGRSRLQPHPKCSHCSKVRLVDDVDSLEHLSPVTSYESPDIPKRIQLASRIVDSDCGIVQRFEDDKLSQTPLFQTSLVVANSVRGHDEHLIGHSIESNADARLRTIREVVKEYSIQMFDERRMWNGSYEEGLRSGLDLHSDSTLSGWTGVPLADGHESFPWLRVRALDDPQANNLLVPAAAVYSLSSYNVGRFERLNIGIGAGFTLYEACNDAVLCLLAHEVLKLVALGEMKFAELDPACLTTANPDLTFLLKSLSNRNKSVRLLTLPLDDAGLILALSPDEPIDVTRVTVGSAQSLVAAATGALIDFLAMSIGTKPVRTLEYFLPPSLGYNIEVHSGTSEIVRELPVRVSSQLSTKSILRTFKDRFSDILIADLTTEDVSSSGMVVVRALFAKRKSSVVHSAGSDSYARI